MSVYQQELMSEVSSKWQGRAVNGTFPLHRCLGSSDHSGVFLTDFAGHEPSAVAIKLVRVIPTLVDAYREQWEEAASLDHSHLIRLLETGRCQFDGQPYLYLVMEHADQTLAQVLEHRALSEDEAREMLLPVLDTLAFLHNRSLVHGQLKPTNVLVVGDQLRLASDTIRKVSEATASINMVSVYDPPEIQDGTVSTAGDMWALGITLFEALTRSPPIGVDVRRESVQLPGQFSAVLREIVGACLSRRPFDRPKAAELAARLRGQSLEGESGVAVPAGSATVSKPLAGVHPGSVRGASSDVSAGRATSGAASGSNAADAVVHAAPAAVSGLVAPNSPRPGARTEAPGLGATRMHPISGPESPGPSSAGARVASAAPAGSVAAPRAASGVTPAASASNRSAALSASAAPVGTAGVPATVRGGSPAPSGASVANRHAGVGAPGSVTTPATVLGAAGSATDTTGKHRIMSAPAGSPGRSAPGATDGAGSPGPAGLTGTTGKHRIVPATAAVGTPGAGASGMAASTGPSGSSTAATTVRVDPVLPAGASAASRSALVSASMLSSATAAARAGASTSTVGPDSAKAQRPSSKPIIIEHFTPELLMPGTAPRGPQTNTAQPAAATPRATADRDLTPGKTQDTLSDRGGAAPDSVSFNGAANAGSANAAWLTAALSSTALPDAAGTDARDSRSAGATAAQEPSLPRPLLPLSIATVVILVLALAGVFILRLRTNSAPPVVEAYQDAPLSASNDQTPAASEEPAAASTVSTTNSTQPAEGAPGAAPAAAGAAANGHIASALATAARTTAAHAMTTAPAASAQTAAASVQASAPPGASTSGIREEMPDVPPHVLQTIRGHVRVSVRLIVDKDGAVFAALVDEPGPSRYFERLAIEAAKKWTFPPMPTTTSRLERVRFDFTRAGATGHAVEIE
jgi:outer membrane biosynthesis protein TonB